METVRFTAWSSFLLDETRRWPFCVSSYPSEDQSIMRWIYGLLPCAASLSVSFSWSRENDIHVADDQSRRNEL